MIKIKVFINNLETLYITKFPAFIGKDIGSGSTGVLNVATHPFFL